ncbi:MAG: polysaccharide deacetylase family protein [Treponema sp.]|jgi:peptidoglycan/xylan/chitin deacetylase (PgdA/CDA1 family)|nr:polysaccharide deacetylase family protein [Treponema sp.]
MKVPCFFLCAALTLNAGAEIRFSGLDLAGSRLLFSAGSQQSSPAGSQLFFSDLVEFSVSRLSAFPEKMTLLDDGRTLLVQSVFGVQSVPVSGGLPRAAPGFPPFTGSFAVPGGAETAVSSADGNWLLFVEPTSSARGDLVLINGKTGTRITVARVVERPGRAFPASWSGDSRLFIYAKSGKLYYYTVNTSAPPPEDERYRFIGEGDINSVCWAGESFYYLKGSALYRVHGAELFARTPYSRFLDAGAPVGKIPFEFDPAFDTFGVAPDGSAMILSKGGRNIFYYPLKEPLPSGVSLPYLMAPVSRCTVIWGRPASVILGFRDGKAAAYRITGRGFEELAAPPGSQAALSPGGEWLVLWGKGGAVLFDYAAWKPIRSLSAAPVLSCVWPRPDELVIGAEDRIERLRLARDGTGRKELVCLSSVDRYGFEKDGNRILARSGAAWYATDGVLPWTEIPLSSTPVSPSASASPAAFPPPVAISSPAVISPPAVIGEVSLVSSTFRVYLEERRSGVFANMPMVRNLSGTGTFPLFPVIGITRVSARSGTAAEERRAPEDTESGGIFFHGSRDSKKVAVCFDLYDDDTGLYQTLDVLSRCGVKASFFLNGEFIRRHPDKAAEIAAAGHETASMFYAPLDLSDSRFRITGDFIARGLARNEDEYNKATGRELSLIWHPPWYSLSPEIALYAAAAGYRTVSRDIDPGDWISREDARRIGMAPLFAADMIDAVMDSIQGGSIVPVRLGLLPGGGNEYLFNRLELLLDAVIRAGYEIVPVSALE